ncbi:MAG TPA: hypothetical protein VNK91_06475, partial [Burkholderiaceae bacterium]|nr:hypothetical protein [Burkholderiaceae bacterium]
LNAKFDLVLGGGGPGLLLSGPDCPGLRRGLTETFHFRPVQGTNDRGSIAKTFDSHVCEALQYAALVSGTARARLSIAEHRRRREERRRAAREAGRFNPLKRRA